MDGAEAICAALSEAGVDTVFGVPGTQTVPLYEALRRSRIRTVTATHELAATFMAQGYFRGSGRLAAVSVIPGPGFGFALAGLAEARLDSAALVLLVGQPPECSMGRRRSQAVDQAAMARPVVKAELRIDRSDRARQVVLQACDVAIAGEPGPVLVQVASHVFREAAHASAPALRRDGAARSAAHDALRAAAEFCASSERVLIYAGQGAADAADELASVVTALGAVVATTPSGRGVLPEDSERVLPLDASGDVTALNSVAAECDAILVLGAALSETGSFGFELDFAPNRLVRVDVSPAVLATPPHARFAVPASSREFLTAVLDALAKGERCTGGRGFDAAAARELRARFRDRRAGGPSDAQVAGGPAQAFFAALRRAIPADGCLVLDSGMHQLLARRHFSALSPRSLLFPTDFQSMAFGLPASIGAKIAHPDRPVVALIGDGGFAMSGLELLTAVRLDLPLPVIVFDDQALGLIRLDQLLSSGHAHATALPPIDYAAMARALGCAYVGASCRDIELQVRAALRRAGPTLIVVPVRDAPALRRTVNRHAIGRTAKAVLGERLFAALRSVLKRN
jgi:acetolactate synthase-1/2/3 large subunit